MIDNSFDNIADVFALDDILANPKYKTIYLAFVTALVGGATTADINALIDTHSKDIGVGKVKMIYINALQTTGLTAKEDVTPTSAPEEKTGPQFVTFIDSNGKEKIAQTIDNMVEAILYDDRLCGHIWYNSLAEHVDTDSKLPWPKDNAQWTDIDDVQLYAYLETKYGFKSKTKIIDALAKAAHVNTKNPLVERLNYIHDHLWDGQTGHIARLLPDYMGVDTPDYPNYPEEGMTYFMLQALRRAFYPGCKADLTLILTGAQGIGKSTFASKLALNDEWFDENLSSLDPKVGAEKLVGKWMLEIAELMAVKRAKEVEGVKAFLTTRADKYRAAYDRRVSNHKRTCVFIASTNNKAFLSDTTGNRRFMIFPVDPKKVKKSVFDTCIEDDMVQAWGEAMDIFIRTGKKESECYADTLADAMKAYQSEYLEEDPRVAMVQRWLNETKATRVCMPMIMDGAFQRTLSQREANEIHAIMDRSITGWECIGRARCGSYGILKCYERVTDWGALAD